MQYNLLFYRTYLALVNLVYRIDRECKKMLRLGAKFVSSIIHAFFSRAEFPVYAVESLCLNTWLNLLQQ